RFSDEYRVLKDPDAVAEPLGEAEVQCLPDARWSSCLSRVMYQAEPGLSGRRADPGDRFKWMRFIARGADSHNAFGRVPGGEFERPPGPIYRSAPRVVEDHPALDPVRRLSLGQPVEHGVEGHFQVAEPLAVCGRSERHLRVAGALGGFIGTELDGDPAEVVPRAQAAADH